MTERRPSVGRASALLGTLIALTVIGSSAVAVALPVLGEELGIDFGGRAWVLAAFSLAFATTTAFFGRLADVVGLRLPLRIGVALFSAGSLVAAAAPGFAPLLLGRLLQGVGAGAVPVIATGVIAAVFDEEQRPRAFGGLTSVVALVSGCGPLIGGGIAALGGWRPVLGLPAIALLLLVPVERLVPAGRPPGTERLDLRGALLTAGVVIGVVLLLQAPATGAGPAVVLAAAGLALGSVALLARHVSRHPEGFLPRVLLRDRRLVLTAVTGPLLLAPYFGLLLAAPQLLRDDRG